MSLFIFFSTKIILITSGSGRRKLQAKNADKFENKGLTYCASCDGPLFEGQDVVVIGGGNAGFESASQLLAYCKSVTLINRSDNFRADPITVEKVLKNSKIISIKKFSKKELKHFNNFITKMFKAIFKQKLVISVLLDIFLHSISFFHNRKGLVIVHKFYFVKPYIHLLT